MDALGAIGKYLEKYADAVDKYIRKLFNKNKPPKEHIREICALTPDAADEVASEGQLLPVDLTPHIRGNVNRQL